jgi:hypothetical protein
LFPNLVAYHIYRGEPIPLPDGRVYDYLLAGNGLFACAETRFWDARLLVASFIVRGLPPLTPAFHLKTDRLSGGVLCELVRHARQRRGEDGHLLESLYRVCPLPERPRIIWPAQTATPGSVSTESDRPSGTLLEIHSHGALPAFWSATDDRDEQGACIYGVMGRLHGDMPEVRLRLGLYGYWLPLALADLFVLDNLPFPIRDAQSGE